MGFQWDAGAAEAYRRDDTTVLLWRPAPCFIVTRVTGPATMAALEFYMARAERAMRAGKIRVFHDWAAMTRYEPGARDVLKRWGAEHAAGFERVHYLVHSKVIAMLISVAALTMGRDLTATTERGQFLTALDAALAMP